MLNMTDAMIYAMETPGAVATAFVEFKTARAVAGFGNEHVDFDRVTPTWTEMLHAHLAVTGEGNSHDPVDDMVISTDQRYHILRPLRSPSCSDMYLYLVVDRTAGSIPLSRIRLKNLEENLAL